MNPYQLKESSQIEQRWIKIEEPPKPPIVRMIIFAWFSGFFIGFLVARHFTEL